MDNENNFIAGTYRTSLNGSSSEYRYFLPNPLPKELNFQDNSIYLLLEDATRNLGELNAYSKLIPDIDMFIMMHEAKEATQSTAIEGTQTNIDEAVMQEEFLSPEKKDDWQEVQNYIKAMRYAVKELETRPLATNLLKDIHYELLQGVRGKQKTPGEMRRSQNWIGGSSIKDAHFIPPSIEHIQDLMSDFDKYINNNTSTPHLIKAAITHYQFETVHPFLDGNGRLGRLLIVLYLIEKKQLDKPILYISDYIARHKNVYYEALDAVRQRNDIEHWIKFFLVTVANTAKESCETLQKIIELKEVITKKVASLGRRTELGMKIINSLYKEPIVDLKKVVLKQKVTSQTANAIITKLVDLELLYEVTGYARNRIYAFKPYLDLFRTKESDD